MSTTPTPDAATRDQVLPVIPPENVTRWHAAIADQLREAFEAVLPVGKYTLGQQLAAFEQEFAAFSDSRPGIGISSSDGRRWSCVPAALDHESVLAGATELALRSVRDR